MQTKNLKKTQLVSEFRYNAAELAKALMREKISHNTEFKVYVEVPGGGDWSNTELEIEDDCKLIVEVTRTIIE
jgi:uracil phosphoribosyltransferase